MSPWIRLLRTLLLFLAGAAALQGQSAQLTPTAVAALPAAAKPGDAVTFSVTVSNSGAQFAVTQSAFFAVTLTNTATTPPVIPPTTPPTPPTGVTPPTELPLTGGSSLATTGGDVPAAMLWGGGAALLLGIALTVLGAVRARSRVAQD